MKIVIFGGTTEGRELSRELALLGAEVTVCVATDYGSEQQGGYPGVTTHTGRLNVQEMAQVLQGAALCVDATHPYAVGVTAAAREACATARVPYRRLLREESGSVSGEIVVRDTAAAAEYLAGTVGNILLTTGVKELGAYAALAPERLFPRILPSHQGLDACEELQIPHRNIIAMQGPFTAEMNLALIRQFSISYLVTKDGGGPGGFDEKRRAAQETGTTLVIIQRPQEQGESYDYVLAECRQLLSAAGAGSSRIGVMQQFK